MFRDSIAIPVAIELKIEILNIITHWTTDIQRMPKNQSSNIFSA